MPKHAWKLGNSQFWIMKWIFWIIEWTAVTLQPVFTDKLYTSFESVLREEQKVYNQYISQRS